MTNRRPALPVTRTHGVASDHIEVGHWLVKYSRWTAEVPARIWLCPHEPGNPENPLDTGPIFVADIAGDDVDPYDIMHGRRVREITRAEYRYRIAEGDWLRQYEPDDPKVRPRVRVDLKQMPPPF